MARTLLANAVIEDFRIQVHEAASATAAPVSK
jgi:phosphoribosylformylglycinamidine (FGAM) synthase PurS component